MASGTPDPTARAADGPQTSTLSDVLVNVGADLWVVHQQDDPVVQSIALREPSDDDTHIPRRAVLLAVGFPAQGPAFTDLLVRAGEAGVSAVIAKPATADPESLRALGELHGVNTVLARQSVDWLQLAALLKASVSVSEADAVAGARLGDLFAFANAVATMAGGATSIVDPAGRVLGFSNLADQPVDEHRRKVTLLMSEVDSPATDPDYRLTYAATGCVFVPGDAETYGRVAAAVRSDGEVLGTIWVIVTDPDQRHHVVRALEELLDAASLHLHHARSYVDVERRREADLLSHLLRDPQQASACAFALEIADKQWYRLATLTSTDPPTRTTEVAPHRLVQRVSTWLHLIQPNAIVAEVDSHLAMLFSGQNRQEWTNLQHNLDDFLRRVEPTAPSLAVVVGRELHEVHELGDDFTHLRTLVRLTALGLVSPRPGGAVVLMDEHLPQLDLALLADWHRSTNHLRLRVPTLERIREYDRERGSAYLETLKTYIESNKSIPATAAGLNVHVNSVRYRIEKLQSLFELDLNDIDVFAWLLLQFRFAEFTTSVAPRE
ncbi:helix-turn-helix domain-containing protein [Streptomyces sp. LHD-70]|uniref:PucR family transcriptional regulator n=1 Tax=Streptomyces sp. LHD-70 TaxID=3072140 RepID=UPI00280F0141|nr:helix-turn-helix domain-containing protein [Streptomyces sp. LHD-70]MDQ8705541.1 helix-turn-helix domain-containing protein [Streptomyces sp. LHD-70]